MKKIRIFSIILFISNSCFCQTSKLSSINLSDGEFEMYVIIGEGTDKEINGLNHLYSSNEKLIGDILTTLILSIDTLSEVFSHYTQNIWLVKDGKVIEEISLYSSLGKVMINDKYYNYDPVKFINSTKKFKQIPVVNFAIKKQDIALKLRNYLRNKKGILSLNGIDTLWVSHEGRLLFQTEFNTAYYDSDEIDSNVEKIIKKYSDENLIEGQNKYYVDLPSNLIPKQNYIPINYDSIGKSRNQLIKTQIKKDSNLDSTDYELSLYVPSKDDAPEKSINKFEKYYFYSSKEIGKMFNGYPIFEEWKPHTNIDFYVYGATLTDIRKILKKL